MPRLSLLILLSLAALSACAAPKIPPEPAPKATPQAAPMVSFTFDDGSTADHPGHPFEVWNGRILSALAEADLRAILFVKGEGKEDARGQRLLQSWDDAGHRLGNHTYTHPNFNKDGVTLEAFKAELMRTDALLAAFAHPIKRFRFPYLKEGDTREKVDGFRAFMAEEGYANGHVSIDASDWYVDQRLRARLRADPEADVSGYRSFYVEHLLERARYYERLSQTLTGRHIPHVLLLHHNLAASLFLGDLIEAFREAGWLLRNADEAYGDPFYAQAPQALPAGESLVWALAKEEDTLRWGLRYPAEDGQYEAPRMDALGL